MAGSLPALVSKAEWPSVSALAERLNDEAAQRPWPRLPAVLRQRVSVVVAAIAPTLSHHRLTLLVRYALWSIVLDDRLDRVDAGSAEWADLRRSLASALPAASASIEETDPFPAELADIHAQLIDGDPDGGWVARFVAQVWDATEAGIAHAELSQKLGRGEVDPPTVEEYLSLAARSVNYRSFAYALLAVAGTAPSPEVLAAVDAATEPAARAVRLANDLRSVARDRAEATLNVTQLRTASGAPVDAAYARAELARLARVHDELLAPLPRSSPASSLLPRSLRVSLDLYRLTDLR